MSVRFSKDCEHRKLRLHFSNGEIAHGIIIDLADPNDGDGFVYDPLSLRSGLSAIWAKFEELEKYEILEN